MSRWSLLKDTIKGTSACTSSSVSTLSVHRFDGFDLIPKKRHFHTWSLNVSMSYGATGEDVERELTRHAQDCVRLVDSCEIEIVCELCPEAIAAQKHAIEIIVERYPQRWRMGSRRELMTHHCIVLHYYDSAYKPRLPRWECWCWRLPSLPHLLRHPDGTPDEHGPVGATSETYVEDVKVNSSTRDLEPALFVYTRETARGAGATARGVLSHKLFGLDNTGNVRVWPSESLLLYLLLTPKYLHRVCFGDTALTSFAPSSISPPMSIGANAPRSSTSSIDPHSDPDALRRLSGAVHAPGRRRAVLELGGGNAALAGLGLAAALRHIHQASTDGNKSSSSSAGGDVALCIDVVVTDGHPDCVDNQEVCIRLCDQMRGGYINAHQPGLNSAISTTAKLLRWGCKEDVDDVLGAICDPESKSTGAIEISRKFDVIFAADCLFFKEFHSELHQTLDALLSDGGCILMLQPSRGRTLELFVQQVEHWGVFEALVHYDYLPEVTELHHQYVQAPRKQPSTSSSTTATNYTGSDPSGSESVKTTPATIVPTAPATIMSTSTTLTAIADGGKADLYDPDIHLPVLLEMRRKARF